MRKFAVIEIESGEVLGVMSPSTDDVELHEVIDPSNSSRKYIEILEDLWQTFNSETYWWNGTMWRVRPAPLSKHHTWDKLNLTWEINTESLFREIRTARNAHLTRCDWTQINDAPLTEEQKAEWSTYRQALRDIPANNPNVEFVSEVNWPTPPTT